MGFFLNGHSHVNHFQSPYLSNISILYLCLLLWRRGWDSNPRSLAGTGYLGLFSMGFFRMEKGRSRPAPWTKLSHLCNHLFLSFAKKEKADPKRKKPIILFLGFELN